MQKTEIYELTRSQLVVELKSLGCLNVTERKIIDWQGKGLLPAFDVIGPGLGQRRGRRRSAWSDGGQIIEQAIWVHKLLRAFGNVGSLYVPLWILGYAVPASRFRNSLIGPLSTAVRSIAAEAGTTGQLEDIIDDAAFEVSSQLRAAVNTEVLHIPREWLEWCASIFFVQDYPVDDAPLQYGAGALHQWQSAAGAELAGALGRTPEEYNLISQECGDSFVPFGYGTFLKKYFSLGRLNSAAVECTDADLEAAQRDAQVLVQIARLFWKLLLRLCQDLPAALRPAEEEVLLHALALGRMLIWADISLRRDGFGEIINHSLRGLLAQLQQEVGEAEQKVGDASQGFATVMSELIAYFERLIESSPSNQKRSYSYYGIQTTE